MCRLIRGLAKFLLARNYILPYGSLSLHKFAARLPPYHAVALHVLQMICDCFTKCSWAAERQKKLTHSIRSSSLIKEALLGKSQAELSKNPSDIGSTTFKKNREMFLQSLRYDSENNFESGEAAGNESTGELDGPDTEPNVGGSRG